MRKVAIDKVEAGMILARAVLAKSGMVLLSEGTVLTAAWVERLLDMDLDGICIDAPSEQALPKGEALAQLDARFRPVLDQPHMGLLKGIVKSHIEGLYG